MLKTQQRFISEKHNVFTEESSKLKLKLWEKNAVNWFDRNICIWSKQRSSKWKEEIKCHNIIKRYKKWLTLIMLQKKA